MSDRDDAHWAGMSASVERGDYIVAGPVTVGRDQVKILGGGDRATVLRVTRTERVWRRVARGQSVILKLGHACRVLPSLTPVLIRTLPGDVPIAEMVVETVDGEPTLVLIPGSAQEEDQ